MPEQAPTDFSEQRVVYTIPNMEEAIVQRDIVYKRADTTELLMDVYYPADYEGETRLPAVIFIHGDGPAEFLKHLKDSGQYVSWGQLAAASGLIAVTFNHRSTEKLTRIYEVASDIDDLIRYVRANSKSLGINTDALCIWVCSAGSPYGLRAALREDATYVKCAVCYYGVTDLKVYYEDKESPEEPDIVKQGGPTLPLLAQKDFEEFSSTVRVLKTTSAIPPMLLVRAGLDEAALNASIDRLANAAIARNVSLDFLNHSTGHHAFDLLDDNVRSKEIIQATLDFMKTHLLAHPFQEEGE